MLKVLPYSIFLLGGIILMLFNEIQYFMIVLVIFL